MPWREWALKSSSEPRHWLWATLPRTIYIRQCPPYSEFPNKKITLNSGDTTVKGIIKIVRWFCSQLSVEELFAAYSIILEVINGKRPDIKTKDTLRSQYPNYRNFIVDPLPPLTELPAPKPIQPDADWKELLKAYRRKNAKDLKPVKRRDSKTSVLNSIRCPHCNAPGKYIYFNDGKKRFQLRCKVCDNLFQTKHHHRPQKTKYWCPHCSTALYLWKKSEVLTIYKCSNDKCSQYLAAKNKLSKQEKSLQQQKSSQFKLRYQYREYHYDPQDLKPASPQMPYGQLNRIHGSLDTLGLVLALNVSYGLSSRTTADMLKNVFGISISHQTVLNYAYSAAFVCHKFNMLYKGPVDFRVAGDETYIRIKDNWNYTWFIIGCQSRSIHAYHVSDSRDALHALITLKETTRTLPENITIELIADGNPSYDAAVHAINAEAKKTDPENTPLQRRKVIGLQNLDDESTEFRSYKQIIERLNRTYKFHTRARCGFKDFNGAVALTVLFVTHYNFLRPHFSLNKKCPVPIADLENIQTIQGRWGKIIEMSSKIAA